MVEDQQDPATQSVMSEGMQWMQTFIKYWWAYILCCAAFTGFSQGNQIQGIVAGVGIVLVGKFFAWQATETQRNLDRWAAGEIELPRPSNPFDTPRW